MSHEEILRVENIEKKFGGLKALNKISLSVYENEILGLVGPNGSGKTTLINVISGIYKPDNGKIYFKEKRIDKLPPYKLSHLGINRTFQIPKPFHGLTVRENVEVAALYSGKQCFKNFFKRLKNLRATDKDYCNVEDDVQKALTIVGLEKLQDKQAMHLNTSEQKLLGLARALATQPKLLLVDEMAAGLNKEETDRIAEILISLAKNSISIIVVEHLMHFIRKITSRVVVMDSGLQIFEGTIDQAANDPKVVEVFLGG
jgi:branched-chain amino acid transport system ATP-binding protein